MSYNITEFPEGMREISGFGGEYEDECRKMVIAGLKWFDENPNADPKFHGWKGIYGIIDEDNEDAKALSKAITDVSEGCTGAMHQAAISHLMYIRNHSWDAYVQEMRS